MSLATRCTACGTIFRVVQDQLRVSEGWVRCGRCAEVFDAREQLFDIDHEPPPPWAETPAPPDSAPDDIKDGAPTSQRSAHAEVPEAPSLRQEPRWESAAAVKPDAMPAETVAEPQLDHAASENERTGPAAASDDHWIAERNEISAPVTANESSFRSPAELPSFMRTKTAASRWHSRRNRQIIVGASLLLLLALGLQLAIHFRDAIAALYPKALPSIQQLCRLAACTNVQAWQRIDALSVENSALTQASPPNAGTARATQRFQLSLSLHNKSGVAVGVPAIELSLLDPAGGVVLRKVLLPADLHTDYRAALPNSLPPGADLPLQGLIETQGVRISGYTVEIFYP